MRKKLPGFIALIFFVSILSAPAVRSSYPAPKLILIISVDQMRSDYLTRFGPLYRGGFEKLLRDGAVFTNAEYRHANTETGPGHAVIMTGRHPSHTGIVANNWYNTFLKQRTYVVDDPSEPAIGGKGRAASPLHLDGVTLGDLLKQKSPASRTVSIALKDRAAILMAGHRAEGAYWFEPEEGRLVTSTYYQKRVPIWLDQWNDKHFPDQFEGRKWERINSDVSIYQKFAGPDSVPGEWDGKNNVFPHVLPGTPHEKIFYDELSRTPFGDEILLDAALDAMKAFHLGEAECTDIFAIGFSATDLIGHRYGPDSQEIMDQMLRLDLVLQTLFHAIDHQVGLSNTLVVLTADHGVMPLVEVLQSKGISAKRVSPSILRKAVEDALTASYPAASELIADYLPPHFYLNEAAIRRNHYRKEEIELGMIRALKATGVVAAAYRHTDLMKDPPKNDPYFSFVRNSFFSARSPDVIVVLKPYIYLDDSSGGTGHGTLHEYDRHVPVIFMGRGIQSGKYALPCGPEDIAPTIAHLLGLALRPENDSRLLLEMFR